jgi:hypothetical protein
MNPAEAMIAILKESQNVFLREAYGEVQGALPKDLSNWQIAEGIVEVLGDANWLSADLAKECLYAIVHVISYPDRETQIRIVGLAEEKASAIFPELAGIDEVHMDQIEWVYEEWKRKAS